jgi:futalosine hydrolase
MQDRIWIVAATKAEADIIGTIRNFQRRPDGYLYCGIDISVLITGVGSVPTSWEMQKWIAQNEKPGLAINIGIAGSYDRNIPVGEVVLPVSDCFADTGIEDGNRFRTLFEEGLAGASDFPFVNGVIGADKKYCSMLEGIVRPVKAITVNTATGSDSTRDRLIEKFDPDIETMEGATFFYICSMEAIPFIALRSVSNMVERRDRSSWDIQLALNNLAIKLEEVIFTLK